MRDTGWIAATEFVRHPSMVGSAFPASSRMVRRMLAPLDWSNMKVLVEYGPGSGRFTFEMLKRMRPDAQLIAIETSQAFASKLREQCDDPRLVVVEGSARDVRRHIGAQDCGRADCILTGLPFSTLGAAEAKFIMHETALALKPTGVLAAYQMRTASALLSTAIFPRCGETSNGATFHPVISTGLPVRSKARRLQGFMPIQPKEA